MKNLKKERINQRIKMNCGKYCTIIGYNSAIDMRVRFDDGKEVEHCSYFNFINGKIMYENLEEQRNNRLGETRMMNCGMKATIIKYKKRNDIDVKFEDGYISKNKDYKMFLKGSIHNKNLPYSNFQDLSGKRFGRWTVINKNEERIEKKRKENKSKGTSNSIMYWNCICDCGNKGVVSSSNLKNNFSMSCGCLESELTIKRNKETKTLYGTIEEEHPELLKYLINEEDKNLTLGVSNKIQLKCPICKKEKKISVRQFINNGLSCPNCSEKLSFPNKFMYKVLNQFGYKIETEYVFDWAKNKRYDFYIKEINCIIEVNGLQHYKNCSWSNVEDVKNNDLYKKEIALKNGIKNYIIIDCRKSEEKYIKNSIINNKDFSSLFNINKIDWKICNEAYLRNNNFSIVIDMYNKGNLIEDIFNKTTIKKYETIESYLYKGNRLGLCNYKKMKKEGEYDTFY